MIKAMILGAGKGTRVRPLTNHTPKPMLPIINKPLIEHIILHLKHCGINHMVVNTSYRSQDIENYLLDGARLGVHLGFSFEGYINNDTVIDKPIGSAGGMKKVQTFSNFFDDTFVVVCGDALIDVDFNQVIAFHRKNKALATIVMQDVPKKDVSKYGVVVTDSSGKITQFQEKPAVNDALSTTINTGIYVFEPAIFDFIPSDTEYDIGSQLFPDLVAKGLNFYGITLPFQWIDVGSTGDFWLANRAALLGEINHFSMPGTQIKPGVWVGENVKLNLETCQINAPVYIGPGTAVENGVRIQGPCIIGAQSFIGANAQLEECILGNHSFIGHNTHVRKFMFVAGDCMDIDGNVIGKPTDAGLSAYLRDNRMQPLPPPNSIPPIDGTWANHLMLTPPLQNHTVK